MQKRFRAGLLHTDLERLAFLAKREAPAGEVRSRISYTRASCWLRPMVLSSSVNIGNSVVGIVRHVEHIRQHPYGGGSTLTTCERSAVLWKLIILPKKTC